MTPVRTPASEPAPVLTGARQRLLRAAIEELASTGHIEVASVARRAQVSVGLPYRYFGTRSGLIAAVLADFHERLDEQVMLARFDGAHWLDQQYARLVAWVNFLYDDPITPIVLGRGTGDGEVATAALTHLHRMIELGARNFAAGQRSGDLAAERDPRLMSAALLGGVHTTVVGALTSTPRPERARLINELFEFVAGAVGQPGYVPSGGTS
jgi:AcrR family transcriptional regulator